MPPRQHLARPIPVVDSPSSTHVHLVRPFLRTEDLCVGCVVWLPHMKETSDVRPFRASDEVLKAEGYYHPVVILGITPRPAPAHISELKICFAIITTFRGVSLLQYESNKESLRPSIAIVNTVNPGNSPYLHLESNRRLRKQSYVRIENLYETSIANLRSYVPDIDLPAYYLRLDKKSYHKLMSLLSLDPQDYPATKTLKSSRNNGANARTPLQAPTSATSHIARNPDVTSYIQASVATQALPDSHSPVYTPAPIVAQNLHDILTKPHSPEDPAWNLTSRQTAAAPPRQPRSDMFIDLESRILPETPSPPYVSYGTTMELPAPAVHSSEQRRSPCEGAAVVAAVCFCVSWMLVGYAGWLVWRVLGA